MKLEARTYADTVVVAPEGRLDHDNCEAFRTGLQPYLAQAVANRQRIVLDLSGLAYVSSAGLRCFRLARATSAFQCVMWASASFTVQGSFVSGRRSNRPHSSSVRFATS